MQAPSSRGARLQQEWAGSRYSKARGSGQDEISRHSAQFHPCSKKKQILSLFLIALSAVQAEDKVRSCVLHGRMLPWPLFPESQSCPTPCHCVTVK